MAAQSLTSKLRGTRLYMAWYSMKSRCLNRRHDAWADYGGRGITVSDRWLSFDAFVEDMGTPPPGATLERRENDKGYSADNCYWALRTAQARNRRSTKLNLDLVAQIRARVAGGESRKSVARSLGVNHSTVSRVVSELRWSTDADV